MTPNLCATLAAYNQWINTRVYDAAATLPEAQVFQDRGAFFGSLFDTLNHIAVADLLWLHRFVQHPGLVELAPQVAGLPQPSSLRQRVAGSLPELRALRVRLDGLITELAARVSEAHLALVLPYSNVQGQAQAKPFGLLLMHLFNHQTHHRGQASTLLFQAGVDVGVTDLNALLPNEA